MTDDVATSRKSVTAYLTDKQKEGLAAYADSQGLTMSKAIIDLIEKVCTDSEIRFIPQSDEYWRALCKWAEEEHRTPIAQAQWVLESAIRERGI